MEKLVPFVFESSVRMPTRKKPGPTQRDEHEEPIEERLDTQTIALRVIAGLLLVGAAYLLAGLFVPFVLALFLTIALSPVASWLERRARFPRPIAALACALSVALAFAVVVGMILYEAGTIVQNTDKYLNAFGSLLADVSEQVDGSKTLKTLGLVDLPKTNDRTSTEPVESDPGLTDIALNSGLKPPITGDEAPLSVSRQRGESHGRSGQDAELSQSKVRAQYTDFLRRNVQTAGRWVMTGLGGLLGFLGGLVIFLAYVFYMLNTRDEWMIRVRRSLGQLGVQVQSRHMLHLRQLMVTYIGYLFLVSLCYAAVLSVALWLIGVPQPLLWGVITGVLEVVPYFGPILAATLPTIVALSLGTWWQPLAVLGVYVALQTIEGYVITPLLYGSAVRLNPVTIIFGLLFFGWLWGPLGLMTAMPMMILLRGLVTMSPDTPALDAFVEEDPENSTSPAASVE